MSCSARFQFNSPSGRISRGRRPPGYPRRAGARHLFILHFSLFTWLPLWGSCRRSRLRGRPPQCRCLSGPAGPGRKFVQTCDLRGLPGPGPRMTFCPARKSSKSRLREGGFRFPPSLKNPISLKRPRPGACGPPPWIQPRGAGRGPGGRPLSHGAPCQLPRWGSQVEVRGKSEKGRSDGLQNETTVVAPSVWPLRVQPAPPSAPGEPRVGRVPGERQRKEKQGAQVCPTSTALLQAPGQRASGWGR